MTTLASAPRHLAAALLCAFLIVSAPLPAQGDRQSGGPAAAEGEGRPGGGVRAGSQGPRNGAGNPADPRPGPVEDRPPSIPWLPAVLALAAAAGVLALAWLRRRREVSGQGADPLANGPARWRQDLERKEGEIRRLEAQLMHSEKMAVLGQLVAGVAHEMSNSINFVSSGLPSLERDLGELSGLVAAEQRGDAFQTLDRRLRRLLAAMREGTARTAEIVQHLRSFSRPDGDETRSLELSSALDSTLGLLHYQVRDRIRVVRDYGADVPEIRCHEGQLKQVLMNLLVNAVQAIDGEGTITLTTARADAAHVRIAIRDDGRGMDEDVRARAFEPFFTTKPASQGTGLGLAISRRIIDKHGGSIDLVATTDRGTEVSILLPIGTHRREHHA